MTKSVEPASVVDEDMVGDFSSEEEVVLKPKGHNKHAPKAQFEVDIDAEMAVTINKGKGTDLFPVPDATWFGSQEFVLDDGPLTTLMVQTIDGNLKEFAHLKSMYITVYWRKAGGQSKGKPTQANVLKPSGLLYCATGGPDYILWVAADNCQKLSRRGMEQVLYRQLMRMGKEGIRDFDFRGFASELSKYGAEVPELASVVKSLRQLGFDDVLPAEDKQPA